MSYSSTPPQGPNLGALTPPEDKKAKKSKDKAAKKTTKRVVNRQIVIAGAFAVLVGLGVLYFVTKPEPGQYVVRATEDIAAMTPMSVELVEAVRLPDDAIEPSALSAANATEALAKAEEAFAGSPRAKFLINAKQQISLDDFGADLALDTPLVDGERLLSISATVANGVAGQLKPGDIVDILGTAPTNTGGPVTGTVASNIPIVSVTVPEDQYRKAATQQQSGDTEQTEKTSLLPADPISPGIYLVRVPADVAVGLVALENSGTLTLIYRGAESSDLEPATLTAVEAICAANPSSAACLGAPLE